MEKNKKDITGFNAEDSIKAEDFPVDESLVQNGNPEEVQDDLAEPAAAEDEVAKLKTDLEEQKDKYLRLAAEFDNYRRRSSKERLELIQTAGKEVISSLLQVLDDSDRAERQMQETNDPGQVKEGVQLVFNKLRKTLQAQGLKAMESLNTDFDVEKHEAITEIPVEDKKLKGKVVDEVEKGYYLNDKLIRFAKVVVGK
ncbi:MAG: nucleotide exchange factor GrpE [Ginsengibacter sp.]